MKKSNLYHKQLVLDENIKKYMGEKGRKEKMLIDSEIFFRKQAAGKAGTHAQQDKSAELLKDFNRIVL